MVLVVDRGDARGDHDVIDIPAAIRTERSFRHTGPQRRRRSSRTPCGVTRW
jgi:hypothetical protein